MAGKIGKRLFGPAQLAGASATIYTVPANRRGCVRHIHLINPTGGAVTVTMGIGVDAAGTRILDAKSLAAAEVYDLYCKIDLEAAETLRAHASAAASIVATIGGDEEIFA
jgi:hypothetical protein